MINKKLDEWSDTMKIDTYYFLQMIMQRIARKAVDNLRKNKSVDTNALVESVKAKVVFVNNSGRSKRTSRVWAGVGIDRNVKKLKKYKKALPDIRRPVFYAHLIEKGFTHMPDGSKVDAKPFLQPAVNSVSGGIEAIQKKLAEIIYNASHKIENTDEVFKMDWEL